MKLLTGTVQNYAWGSTDEIPRALGLEPDGKPQAEYWMGAHPSAPSQVDGRGLDELVAENPAIVGARSTALFGERLPYLMKLLAANQPLSLQAHPSRAQAEEGFARENAEGIALSDPTRTYKDDWPKPEMMVALTDFEALCGFREAAETARLFAALGIPELDLMMDPLTLRGGSAALAEVFLDALSGDEERRDLVNALVVKASQHVDDSDPEVARFAETAVILDESYPGDPSIIAGLMLNRLTMSPGQAIFLPAGNMHAYLKGFGVEIMANSDNVLRGGLTPKHIDVDELVRVVDFAASPVSLVETREEAPGLFRYLTPAPEFVLWRIEGDVQLPAGDLGRELVVVEGSFTSSDGLELGQGSAAWIDAGEEVSVTGRGMAFLAAPGV